LISWYIRLYCKGRFITKTTNQPLSSEGVLACVLQPIRIVPLVDRLLKNSPHNKFPKMSEVTSTWKCFYSPPFHHLSLTDRRS
jgi:hypothetical protein